MVGRPAPLTLMNVDNKRKYQREWFANRRAEWFESQGGKCKSCGSTEELECDHIDPDTKGMNPSRIWSRCKAVRDEELAKCQVLCHNCHLTKTMSEHHGANIRYYRH